MTPEEKLRCYAERVGLMGQDVDYIAAIIRRAVLVEREACAKLAESQPFSPAQMDDGARSDIAAAIRARKDA